MERAFLKGLGFEDEVIEKIMAEHGKTTQAIQAKLDTATASINDLTAQITQRDTDLAGLKAASGDNADLKQKFDDLTATYTAEKVANEQKIKDLTIASAIKLELAGKVHDPDLVASLIDSKSIELDDKGAVKSGLKEKIEDLQKNKAFLFVDQEAAAKFTGVKPAEGVKDGQKKEESGGIGSRLGKETAAAQPKTENPYFK